MEIIVGFIQANDGTGSPRICRIGDNGFVGFIRHLPGAATCQQGQHQYGHERSHDQRSIVVHGCSFSEVFHLCVLSLTAFPGNCFRNKQKPLRGWAGKDGSDVCCIARGGRTELLPQYMEALRADG